MSEIYACGDWSTMPNITQKNRYSAESDGGDFWTGRYWSRQAKTYYVVDNYDFNVDRIECETMNEARKLTDQMNKNSS